MKVETEQPDAMPEHGYGYGLCIYLTDKQCEALGITTPLKAGSLVTVNARAMVKEATESMEPGEESPEVRMSLQITEMGIEPAKGTPYFDNSEMMP
jgi:hypothetical protein